MKLSLHLGLNVVNPEFYSGWFGYLQACVNDARDMAALFMRAGFTSKAVFNLEVTIDRLRGELAAAASTLVAGDTFLLSYSGHGGRAGAWTWSGYTETLCLASGEFSDSELREALARFSPGVRVIVLLDSCHSAGMVRAQSLIRAKPGFVKSIPVVVGSEPKAVEVPAQVLMWTACTAEETALDGEVNGAFTSSLLTVADIALNLARPFSWESWITDTQAHMAKFFPAQHPVATRYGSAADWNIEIA